MAKVTSSSSAAPTPRRSTRSQSAEPQGATTARGTRSRTASEQPVEQTEPRSETRRGGRTRARNVSQELPTVDENALLTDEENDSDTEARPAEQLENGKQGSSPRRSSQVSAISGTTVKTSFSHEEIEMLDAEIMVDVLPDLEVSASSVIQLLLPDGSKTSADLWKEIKRPGSRPNKLYNHRLASLGIHRSSFATREYIRPSNVVRALLDVQSLEDVPQASWRPDEALCKVNLAQMLSDVLITCNPQEWTPSATDALERLDMAFPAGISGSQFDLSALQFWLDIAAQVAIRRLEAAIDSDPNFAPHNEINNVFYVEDGVFKHNETLGLNTLSEQYRQQADGFLDDLITLLKEPFEDLEAIDASTALGHLKTRFRWDSFRDHMLTYYEVRRAEVDQHISEAGGIFQMKEALASEIARRADERFEEKVRESLKKSGTPRSSLGGKNVMAALKGRQMQGTAPIAPMVAPVQNSEDTVQVDQDPVFADDQADEDILVHDFGVNQQPHAPKPEELLSAIVEPTAPARDQATATLMQLQAKAAKKGKGRFIDRQPGAVRIDHEMNIDDETQATPVSTTAAKRSHAQMTEEPEDFDPTQDEGFQVDDRDHSRAEQLRRDTSFQRVPRPRAHVERRPSPATAAGPSELRPSPASSRPSPRKRQRQNPGSLIPPPSRSRLQQDVSNEPQLNEELYNRAKNDAKFNRVFATQYKPPQQRTGWSDEEESTLIDLIREHADNGISYSALKAIDVQEGNVLANRTAEDMRFKARNMTLTMLLAGVTLPHNWDKVVLDKKAVDKLHARGIEYERVRIRSTRQLDE